jgi:hypothetical protein
MWMATFLYMQSGLESVSLGQIYWPLEASLRCGVERRSSSSSSASKSLRRLAGLDSESLFEDLAVSLSHGSVLVIVMERRTGESLRRSFEFSRGAFARRDRQLTWSVPLTPA